MTPTRDEQDIRDWLHGTARRAALRPLESGRLLDRGRRGRRRRRLVAGAGAAVAVAAVAVAASTLPDLNDARRIAPVTTPSPSTSATTERAGTNPAFTPVPGVPPGEAALGDLGQAEAIRRCRIRHPDLRRGYDEGFLRAGFPMLYQGADKRERSCLVPGDSRPKASTVAAAVVDPMPSAPADILRNCSVLMWHDLSAWRVVASDRQSGVQLIVVLLSPSGKHDANCRLTPEAFDGAGEFDQVNAIWDSPPGMKRHRLEHIGGQGSQTCGTQNRHDCAGWMFYQAGRVDSRIALIRITAKNGRTHDVLVRDGWYALAWSDGDPKGGPDGPVVAFDAEGNRVIG